MDPEELSLDPGAAATPSPSVEPKPEARLSPQLEDEESSNTASSMFPGQGAPSSGKVSYRGFFAASGAVDPGSAHHWVLPSPDKSLSSSQQTFFGLQPTYTGSPSPSHVYEDTRSQQHQQAELLGINIDNLPLKQPPSYPSCAGAVVTSLPGKTIQNSTTPSLQTAMEFIF